MLPIGLLMSLSIGLPIGLPVRFGFDVRGYVYTDPARFGGLWETESSLERERRQGECFCEDDANAALWTTFQRQ